MNNLLVIVVLLVLIVIVFTCIYKIYMSKEYFYSTTKSHIKKDSDILIISSENNKKSSVNYKKSSENNKKSPGSAGSAGSTGSTEITSTSTSTSTNTTTTTNTPTEPVPTTTQIKCLMDSSNQNNMMSEYGNDYYYDYYNDTYNDTYYDNYYDNYDNYYEYNTDCILCFNDKCYDPYDLPESGQPTHETPCIKSGCTSKSKTCRYCDESGMCYSENKVPDFMNPSYCICRASKETNGKTMCGYIDENTQKFISSGIEKINQEDIGWVDDMGIGP